MITYKIKKNTVTINNKLIEFENTIKMVYEYNDILIVLENYTENNDNDPNVTAFSQKGKELWTVQTLKGSNNKYIDIKEEKGNLILIGEDRFKYLVDEMDGKFLRERIQPLRDIDDKYETLFTKTNAIQLGVLVIISLLILVPLKNFFTIDTNKTSNSNQIEQTINKESISQNSESIKNDNNNLNNTPNTNTISDEERPIISESKEENIENNVETTSKTQVTSTEKEPEKQTTSNKTESSNNTEKKQDGFGIIADLFGNISDAIINGESSSIEDATGKVTEYTFIEVIDSCRIKAKANNKEVTIKLIGINKNSNCTKAMATFLSKSNKIYIEQDTKKTNNDGEILAYVWITEKKDDKNNMLNYYLIAKKYATFEMQTPNIKYNYYFQTAK